MIKKETRINILKGSLIFFIIFLIFLICAVGFLEYTRQTVFHKVMDNSSIQEETNKLIIEHDTPYIFLLGGANFMIRYIQALLVILVLVSCYGLENIAKGLKNLTGK